MQIYQKERKNTRTIKMNDIQCIPAIIVYEYEIHHKLLGKTFWIEHKSNYRGD